MNRKIIEFAIVSGTSSEGVASTINDLISDGWEPLGGVSIGLTPTLSSPHYAQSIVKYKSSIERKVTASDLMIKKSKHFV
jgi:hypothetical protein